MSTMAPLLFKAWLESRGRFLVSAALLGVICVSGVFCRASLMKVFVTDERFVGDPYVGYIYRLVYNGTARGLFVIMVMVLALGGLQRERLHRTMDFTLALPARRAQLLSAQLLLGLMEVAFLSALPLLLLAACAPLAHVWYPMAQMARFGLLWFAGGTVFFAVTFLSATLFRGEYTALAAAFVFTILYPVALVFPPLNRYPLNINHIMSGIRMPYFDTRTALLAGPPPWVLLALMLSVAGILLALAVHIAQRGDWA